MVEYHSVVYIRVYSRCARCGACGHREKTSYLPTLSISSFLHRLQCRRPVLVLNYMPVRVQNLMQYFTNMFYISRMVKNIAHPVPMSADYSQPEVHSVELGRRRDPAIVNAKGELRLETSMGWMRCGDFVSRARLVSDVMPASAWRMLSVGGEAKCAQASGSLASEHTGTAVPSPSLSQRLRVDPDEAARASLLASSLCQLCLCTSLCIAA